MTFLTAPLDMQRSAAYESALALLSKRHCSDQLYADRDLFEDFKSYTKNWKQVYDPEKADRLYVMVREDGTIGLGTYQQYKRLSIEYDVPARLLLAQGEQAVEAGEFTVSLIEESERSNRVFAVVSPERVGSGSSGSNGGRSKASGKTPRKAS